ncbi:MAG: rRNA maturation RNase YbeY [Anaerolineae bacterium]|nr:rRNA maturation RNase YbeY [Anaerolineae bacterium]
MTVALDVTIQIEQPFATLDPARIKAALQTTVEAAGRPAPSAESVAVVITDSETVQALNRQFRGVEAPTDVLSFENSADPDFPGEAAHLGDIIIAYPIAEAQALAGGHETVDEIILLAVHGLLHLLGFDHDTPENKNDMWTRQQEIMARLDLAHVQPTES